MLRYIHTFIRFSWLFAIPMLVAPAVVALVMMGSSSYTATAALWVEQPLYLEQQRNTEGSFWDSPATQVSGQINELMSTRAFLTTVLESTGMNTTLKTETDRAAMLEYINKNFKVEANGWRLINLSYKDKEARPALEVLDAIVSKYKGYYDERIAKQGDGAIAYYQSRVKATKDALDRSNKALEDFLAANPNKIGSEGATRAVRPEDLEFATLTQNRDAARKQYDDANVALEKVQASYGAYLQGQDTTLKIQDKPEVFSTSSGKARQAAMGAAIGFAVGVILAVLGTVALTLLDGTIRQPLYAQRALGMGRVLELSNVNPVYGWYKWRKERMLARLAHEAKALPEGTQLEGGINKTNLSKVKPRFVLRQSFGEQIQVAQLQGENS